MLSGLIDSVNKGEMKAQIGLWDIREQQETRLDGGVDLGAQQFSDKTVNFRLSLWRRRGRGPGNVPNQAEDDKYVPKIWEKLQNRGEGRGNETQVR